MRKGALALLLTIAILLISTLALAQQDVDKHPSCKYCGMDRKMFAHSRMFLVYDDGSELGTCSLHCVAVDMALNIDKSPKSIQVADFNTKNLIDAEKAVWVIGGEKPGVMSKRAKWAFEKKADAETYIKANKGTLANFEAAIKASYEDMYSDTRMIREKRKAKRMKQGS
ncbi:MAG: nitrous oxide reductase accessory protein NosL [Deltaproteobacteria bacterium]|nr:nitrous oxide reductase accessory protein NosL [Deltaproteobacteria bacterium]